MSASDPRRVPGRPLGPPPLRRREPREEERMRPEHEIDIREHRGKAPEEVRMLEERRKREAVRLPVYGVVRTYHHLLPRRPCAAFSIFHFTFLKPVHLAVADGERVVREERVLCGAHRPGRLVGHEIAPREDDVREERRLPLVREEESAVAVVEYRDKRAFRKPLSRPVGIRLVLVEHGGENDVRIKAPPPPGGGVVEPHHRPRIAPFQRTRGLVERFAQEFVSPRHARGDGDERPEARVVAHLQEDGLAREHGRVADEEGD